MYGRNQLDAATYKNTKLSQLEPELQDIYERIQNLEFEIHKIKKFK